MISLLRSLLGTICSDTRGEQRFHSVWRTPHLSGEEFERRGADKAAGCGKTARGLTAEEDELQHWILLLPVLQPSYIMSFSPKYVS